MLCKKIILFEEIFVIIALEFLRPQNVSQNREERCGQCNFLVSNCSKRCFPVETLRTAILSGWILLFQTTPLEDFLENIGRSFSRSSKGKGKRHGDTTTARFGELLRLFHFFALHFLSSLSYWMNLLTLLKASFARLTNEILVI